MGKAEQVSEKVEAFNSIVNKYNEYEDLIGLVDLSGFRKIAEDFQRDAGSALEVDRLLRIGVIGQIKRGKSTFLNALLFGGDDVLPKAATPMTAALTRISYAEKPQAEVFFYGKENWDVIRTTAESVERKIQEAQNGGAKRAGRTVLPELTDEEKSCHELFTMVRKQDTPLSECLGKSVVIDNVSSAKDLVDRLADYVGAEGRFTPIVERTEIRLNIEGLKGIEVIDTPGMNDPIISRGRLTQDFIGQCDVVFLLSLCSQFLDYQDMSLMAQNIPSRGISNIFLVGSLYDSALMDLDPKSIGPATKAIPELNRKLNDQASSNFAKVKTGSEAHVIAALESAFPPVFVSSMCYNIAKHMPKLGDHETLVLRRLKELFPDLEFNSDLLMQLANFSLIDNRLDEVKGQKDVILSQRFNALLKASGMTFQDRLDSIRKKIQANYDNLQEADIASLEKKSTDLEKHLKQSAMKVEAVFESHKLDFAKGVTTLCLELEKAAQNAKTIRTKEGTETEEYDQTIDHGSGFLWHRDICGTRYETVTRTRTITYAYADIHGAIDQLEQFVLTAKERLTTDIADLLAMADLRSNILKAVKGQIDFNDENFDPNSIIIPVELAVKRLSIPEVKLDCDKYIATVRSQFSGLSVRDGQVEELCNEQARVCAEILRDIRAEINSLKAKICEGLDAAKDSFLPSIVEDIKRDIETLKRQLKDKETAKKRYEAVLELLANDLRSFKA